MRDRIFGFLTCLAFVGLAGFVINHTTSDNFGLVIDAQDLNADDTHWTGWMHVVNSQDLVLQTTLTDANSGVTLTVRCETAPVTATKVTKNVAEDAGFELCGRALISGTETYTCPLVKSLATHGTTLWEATFENVNSRWVNCLFTSTGDGANDELSVIAYGVSD